MKEKIDRGQMPWDWTHVTMKEMKTFLALLSLMGINHLPAVRMYWIEDELYNCPIFGECIDRFKAIFRFWHFNNTANYDPQEPNRNRLFKVRKIVIY